MRLCSTIVLRLASDWFAKRLAVSEDVKEKKQIVFDYSIPGSQFTVATVRDFLHAMHGLEINVSNVTDMLLLIQFIQYERKNGQYNFCSDRKTKF